MCWRVPNELKRSKSGFFIPKPAIALDLDNTLVYVTPIRPMTNDYTTIQFRRRKMYVQVRPHLREFVKKLSKHYDVFIFTSAAKDYANNIVDKILPEIHKCRRLFRDSCQDLYGYFVKDLKKLRRPLNKVLLVDDIAGSALNHPDNLIKISPWQGEKQDNALYGELLPILDQIAYEHDLSVAFRDALKKRKLETISTFI